MKIRKSDDGKPHEARDVQSDQPYYEDASVPGDNDVRTALDPELEKKAQRA
jgi:hypothetical protein